MLKSTLDYVKPFKFNVILIVVLLFISMIFTTIQPFLFGKVIDAIASRNFGVIVNMIIIISVLFLINLVLSVLQRYLVTITGARIEMNVKERLLESILGMKILEFDSVQHGEFINKLENDVRAFSNIITQKLTIIIDLISVFVIGVILFKLNFLLTLILLSLFPISFLIFRYFGKKIRVGETELKTKVDEYFTFLQECLTGFKLIKLLNAKGIQLDKFRSINQRTYSVGIKKSILNIKAGSITELVNFIGYILLIITGTYQIFIGKLTLGGLVAFNSYSSTFTSSLFKLTQLNAEIQEILVSIKRITDLTNQYKVTQESMSGNTSQFKCDFTKCAIQFKNVSFQYKDNDSFILQNLNFRIEPQKTTAIVGESGAGKSTVLNLIAGLYENYQGQITFDGTDRKQIPQNILDSKICFVTQENYIFSQSIKENLLLANPFATMGELINACKQVNIHQYIDGLPEKYDTQIGFKGTQLSIGQQQRLSIARAILSKADIYLFDEITSALDKENEEYIKNFAKGLAQNKTVILVSHKESTLEFVDKQIKIGRRGVSDVSNKIRKGG